MTIEQETKMKNGTLYTTELKGKTVVSHEDGFPKIYLNRRQAKAAQDKLYKKGYLTDLVQWSRPIYIQIIRKLEN
jgi:hypothetical protein